MNRIFILICALSLAAGCMQGVATVGLHPGPGCEYASYFGVLYQHDDSLKVRGIVTVSPLDGTSDTLFLEEPLKKIICMSSSNVAALSSIGAESHIVGVSGLEYLSDHKIHRMAGQDLLFDVGYESSMDYETVVRLSPDLLIAYTVGDAEPPYISKLRALGIPVLVLHDHIEQHPLARAEYVRLFGALTGRMESADAFFKEVRDRYLSLCVGHVDAPVRVLMNIPYADSWYIPGNDGYMSRLIRDAGGLVVGAGKGSASRVINMEEAFNLSQEAEMWLCPGYCRTREQLAGVHHLFTHFGPMAKGLPVYNNILRANSGGGNDFWESGAVRPDLILEDLRKIFSPSESTDRLMFNYFIRLE